MPVNTALRCDFILGSAVARGFEDRGTAARWDQRACDGGGTRGDARYTRKGDEVRERRAVTDRGGRCDEGPDGGYEKDGASEGSMSDA